MPNTVPCPRLRGFTLVEVLVASSLGALLLLAAATSAGLFGKQVEYLNDESTDELGQALAELNTGVRTAWCAEVPDPRHLILTDSTGRKTTYAIESGKLTVTRPDGTKGTVSSNITTAAFTATTVTRYREDAPIQRPARIWSDPAPTLLLPEAYVLEPGEQVGLGFMAASPAPVGGSPVAGVQEQLSSAALGRMDVKLAAVSAAGGSLTLHLYRARGPGDSRPDGASLGSLTISAAGLPTTLAIADLTGAGFKNILEGSGGSGSSGDDDDGGGSSGKSKKKDKKKKKKDKKKGSGSSGGGSDGGLLDDLLGGGSLLVLPPTVSVPIDLSPLGAQVQPGYAYTLVLENTADGPVALEGYHLGSETLSGICLEALAGEWAAQPMALPRSLDGTATVTRTTATPVVESVLVELSTATGAKVSGTVAVLGQSLVADAWLGVVPGEVAP